MLRSMTVLFCFLFVFLGVTGAVSADIVPDGRPASGPGSTENGPQGFDYNAISVTCEVLGRAPLGVKIFEPEGMEGEALPVVVFLHAYWATKAVEDVYTDFIGHLVKKGYLVIYPYYQNAFTLSKKYTPNTADQITMALDHIASNPGDHAQALVVDDVMQIAMVGHSMGGIMAGNLLARYDDYDIPKPLAVCVMNIQNGRVPIEWEDTDFADTNILVIVGEDDTLINESDDGFDPADSKSFWDSCDANIGVASKDWILLKTDLSGDPAANDLLADHRAPTNVDADDNPCLNNIDYYGYWKWATALLNYTFFGVDGDYALGLGDPQRTVQGDMGVWLDSNGNVIGDVTRPDISDSY